ncbi:MAG: urease accessory protein UreD [Phyllobacteriaceae bacterium]|nr:urease accessory protein UreD [Phyllobacteriaceae bacterium]
MTIERRRTEPAAMQRSVGAGRITVKAAPDRRTRLDALHQKANAKIRIPKAYGPALEAVLINTAGGLTGGDRLDWSAAAGAGTHLVIATQACERIYKSAGGAARQSTKLDIGAGARLDWLPQETILFDDSALDRSIEIDLAPDAIFTGLETLVLGRAAMGETVRRTVLRDRWRIRRAGALIHADNLRLDGDISALADGPATLAGCTAIATLVHVAPSDDEQRAALVQRLREALAPMSGADMRAGVSAFAGKCIVRLLAPDAYRLRPLAIEALAILRDGAPLPAVWRS